MSIHRGNYVEDIARKSGMEIKEIASRIGIERGTLYRWFARAHLNYDSIERIAKVIREPMLLEDVMQKERNPQAESLLKEPNAAYQSPDEYKVKYFQLMERYEKLEKFLYEEVQSSLAEIKNQLASLKA